MATLALEASTSAAKAMLYDDEKGVLGVETEPYGDTIVSQGRIDADEAAETVLACGARLVQRHPGILIEAIGLCSIWHGLLLLGEDGRPISPVLTWEDKTAGETAASYRRDRALAFSLYKSTGCPVSATYDLWKWMHLKQTKDIAAVKHLSNLPGYLIYRLTGEGKISSTAASGTGMMALETLDWDEEALELAGLERGMLPEITPPEHTCKLTTEAAKLLNTKTGIPVTVASADGALNHMAAGGLGEKVMTLSVGTSGAVRYTVDRPLIPTKPSAFCYYGGEGMYILGAQAPGAGNCVKWLTKGLLCDTYDLDTLEKLAVGINREDAPYFMPFLFGRARRDGTIRNGADSWNSPACTARESSITRCWRA